MIAVDTSAILALAFDEPDAKLFVGPLTGSPCVVGWPTLMELHMVLRGRRQPLATEIALRWQKQANVAAVPFEARLFDAAIEAFERFGKGLRGPAGLNFGDCMAYAVAKTYGVPLLFKGADFAQTDIRSALP